MTTDVSRVFNESLEKLRRDGLAVLGMATEQVTSVPRVHWNGQLDHSAKWSENKLEELFLKERRMADVLLLQMTSASAGARDKIGAEIVRKQQVRMYEAMQEIHMVIMSMFIFCSTALNSQETEVIVTRK